MIPVSWSSGVKWGNPSLRWGSPSYLLEPGDPGYVPPDVPPPQKPKKKRNYMASNPTPNALDELIIAGEDLCDGLTQHAVAIGIKQNTFAAGRADLDALIAGRNGFNSAQGAKPVAYTGLRLADSTGKGYIARAVKVLSISLGNEWSDAWVPTGLPDNRVGVPPSQDARFAALGALQAYFAANPDKENAALEVTAAIAGTLYEAVSNARQAVGNALSAIETAAQVRDAARDAFRDRYRGTIGELEQLLEAEDPRWYDFGLNRPSDPVTPGIPDNVTATALGGGRVLGQIGGARRANSFNYYFKRAADAEPVKATNTEGTQFTFEGLPVGETVEITVTGVNDAGEGQPSEPVSVVVA